jgi:type IV secretory pathway TraG/TraD family ATPase VirD4
MGKNSAFEGFETTYNSYQMSFKMVKTIFKWTFILYLVTGAVVAMLYLSAFEKKALTTFIKSQFIAAGTTFSKKTAMMDWTNPDGTVKQIPAKAIANNALLREYTKQTGFKILNTYVYSLGMFVLVPVAFWVFRKKAGSQFQKKFIRGAKFLMFNEYEKLMKSRKESGYLPLGDWNETDLFGKKVSSNTPTSAVKMPVSCEPKHTAVIGRPGVGKTVCFTGMISELKKKENFKGIVYCYKGDYVGKFFDPDTDYLLNPLDKRTLKWNIFNEIETVVDIEMVAGSLFPTVGKMDSKDDFFVNGAKDVFIGVLLYLYERGLTSNKELWRHISAGKATIVKMLEDTKGGEPGLMAIGNLKDGQASGVFGTFMKHLKCFKYMTEMDGDFNIRDWLTQGTGAIYISNYENLKETLKPILSLFIDLVGRRLLSMNDSASREIYFILDELHTLQRISSIVELLTLVRSRGGRVVMGTQSYSQLDEIYGERVRHSMINSCGNMITMALNDEKEARIASDRFSEIEFWEYNKTTSMGVSDFKDGISLAAQRKREKLVLPSEVIELPELSAIVQLANYGIMRTRLTYTPYPDKNISFDMRDELKLSRGNEDYEDDIDEDDNGNVYQEQEPYNIDYDEMAAIHAQTDQVEDVPMGWRE